jgi:hypothetical protein
MRRRAFIAGLGSAAAWPVVARAKARPLVALLFPATPEWAERPDSAVFDGLRDAGFVAGSNVAVAERYANGDLDA